MSATAPGGDSDDATIRAASFTPLQDKLPVSPAGPGRARTILIACLVAAMAILYFLLSARSLQVQVQAEGEAQVSISGLVLPFGDRYLLRPGVYEVSVQAAGYHPLEASVTVDDSEGQTLTLVPRPLPGRLTFDSGPRGAKVLLDGEILGTTPLAEIKLEVGDYTLAFSHPRYLPLEQGLQVEGRAIAQQVSVQLLPAWAAVSIDSLPGGATILVDGEVRGQAPATLDLLQGTREMTLQLTAHTPWQQILDIEAGADLDLGQVTLQPAEGEMALSSVPAGANVTLDGTFLGQTPLTVALEPGRDHRLALSRPGYQRYSTTVQLAAGSSDERTVELQPVLGEIRFRISPPAAELSINGRTRGRGDQTLSLPAIAHDIAVSLEGYATQRRRVTPRPGLEQEVEITLLTEREARMARIKPELTSSLGQTLLLFDPASSPMAEFTMGASRREPGRRANEVLHPVGLQRMFYLQTTEVTNAQFRQFAPQHNSGQVEGNSLNRDHQPAVQVSWQQAASFCNWLSAREGLPPFYLERQGIITGFNPAATGYRLPSEAEWAWAARVRGDRLLKFPWGDSFPPTVAVENYADNTSAYVTGRILNGYTDGHVVSAPVASFGPNHHALYDLGGNVAEWVHDVYGIPAANSPPKTDPLGGQQGDNYVIRGAGWAHARLPELRLSYRDYGQAGRDDVGFRIARYAE